MSSDIDAYGRELIKKRKKGNFLPALCNFLGILILLIVIVICLPLAVPRIMGYEMYNVVSGSMEPEIPVDSLIFVSPTAPEKLEKGDIIAFRTEDAVITHRVVRNQIVEGIITTKGDVNADEDIYPVPYDQVIGLISYHVPMLGGFMSRVTSTVGRLYLLAFAASGLMFNLLAAILRANKAQNRV